MSARKTITLDVEDLDEMLTTVRGVEATLMRLRREQLGEKPRRVRAVPIRKASPQQRDAAAVVLSRLGLGGA